MSDVLEYFRELDPGFKDVPDDELREYIYYAKPEFLQDPGFRRDTRVQFGQELNRADQSVNAVPDDEDAGDIQRGRGVASAASSIGQYSKAMSQFGNFAPIAQVVEKTGLGPTLRSYGQVAEDLNPPSGLSDIGQAYREHGVVDAAREAAASGLGNFQEQVPQIMASIATGGAAKGLGLSAKAAAWLAAAATTFPQETGGAYEEIAQRTGQDGPAAAAAAAGAGLLNTGLEVVGDVPIVERALGGGDRLPSVGVRQFARRVAADAAKGFAGEGLTEAAQEVAPAMAPVLFGAKPPENLPQRMAEAGWAGASGGAGFGAVSSVGAERGARAEMQDAFTPERSSPATAPQPIVRTVDAPAPQRFPVGLQPEALVDLQVSQQVREASAQVDQAAAQQPPSPLALAQKAAAKVQIAMMARAKREAAAQATQAMPGPTIQATPLEQTPAITQQPLQVPDIQPPPFTGRVSLDDLNAVEVQPTQVQQPTPVTQPAQAVVQPAEPAPAQSPSPIQRGYRHGGQTVLTQEFGPGNAIQVTYGRSSVDPAFYAADLTAHGDAPTGTGAATEMYVQALEDAVKNRKGFRSDSIASENTTRLYQRLQRAGVPFTFSEAENQFTVTSKALRSTDFKAVRANLKRNAATAVQAPVEPAPIQDQPPVAQVPAQELGKVPEPVSTLQRTPEPEPEFDPPVSATRMDFFLKGETMADLEAGLSKPELVQWRRDRGYFPKGQAQETEKTRELKARWQQAAVELQAFRDNQAWLGETGQGSYMRSPGMAHLQGLTPEEEVRITYDRTGQWPKGAGPAKNPATLRTQMATYLGRLSQWLDTSPPQVAGLDGSEVERVRDAVLRDAFRRYEEALSGARPFRMSINKAMDQVDIDTRQAAGREAANIRKTRKRNVTGGGVASTESVNQEGEEVANPDVEQSAIQRAAEVQRMDDRRDALFFAMDKAAGRPLTAEEKDGVHWHLAEAVFPGEQNVEEQNDFARTPEAEAIAAKTLKMARGDTRLAIESTPVVPISPEDAKVAVMEALGGKLPLNLTIISDPAHVLPNGDSGVGVSGYVVLGDNGQHRTVLNAAFIGSADHAVRTLIHEGLHTVFTDPDIQESWQAVKDAVTPEQVAAMEKLGYRGDRAVEEAAVRNVVASLEKQGGKNVVLKFIEDLWNRLAEFLGIDKTFDRQAQVIMQRWVESLSTKPSSPGPFDGRVRKSITSRKFVNRQDVEQTAAVAGDRQTIATAAELEGRMVPQSSQDRVAELEAGDRTDKQAAQLLSSITNIGDLDNPEWLSTIAAPLGVATVAGAPEEARDTAAQAVLQTDGAFGNQVHSLQRRLEREEEALALALEQLPAAMTAEADALAAGNLAADLITELNRMRDLEAQLAPSTLPAKAKLLTAEASRRISGASRELSTQIGVGLQTVANEIPAAAMTSPPAVRDWITARQAAGPPIFSDKAWAFLTSPTVEGGNSTPLSSFRGLTGTITRLQDLRSRRDEATKELRQIRGMFHVSGKKVSTKDAMAAYHRARTEHRNGMDMAEAIDRRIASLGRNVRAVTTAIEVLQQMLASDQYRAAVTAALSQLNASSPSSIRQIPTTLSGYDGRVTYQNPVTGKPVVLDFTPGLVQRDRLQTDGRELLGNVLAYIGDPQADPAVRSAWEREYHGLQDALGDKAPPGDLVTLVPEYVPLLGGRLFPSIWSVYNRLWLKKLGSANNLAMKVGGPDSILLKKLISARDRISIAMDQMRDSGNPLAPSQGRIQRTAMKAMEAHKLKPSDPMDVVIWNTQIAEPIISQNQNPGCRPFKVGEKTQWGHEVTQADLDAVRAQTSWIRASFALFQRMTDGLVSLSTFEVPLQTQERMGSKYISRSGVAYGYKAPRKISRGGRELVRRWIEGSADDRRAMLRRNYTELVKSLVVETNPEVVLAVDPLDKKLFRDVGSMDRRGEVPFSDYEGFLDWLAAQRYELREEETTEATERDEAAKRVAGYVASYMDRLNTEIKASDDEAAKLVQPKANVGPAITSAVSANNEFTRPRGTMMGPSSFYDYHVTGASEQETLKSNGMTSLMLRELAQWQAVKRAIDRRLEDYELRVQEVRKERGVGQSKARRIVASESRARLLSGDEISDYATLKDNQGSIESMMHELSRNAVERTGTTHDVPAVMALNRATGFLSQSLLATPRGASKNVAGGMVSSAMLANHLNRAKLSVFGGQYILTALRYVAGRALQAFAARSPSFDRWMRNGGSAIARQLMEGMAFTARLRQQAFDAATLDEPTTMLEARAKRALPKSGGILTTEEQGDVVGVMNRIGSVWPMPYVNGFLSRGYAAADRLNNAVVGELERRAIDDTANKQQLWKVWEARRLRDPGNYRDLTRPRSGFTPAEFAHKQNSKSLQIIGDLMAPMGSYERLSLDWYERARVAADPMKVPFFRDPAMADALVLEVLKMTNVRAPSTSQDFTKGKGFVGWIRRTGFMFQPYGLNMAPVWEHYFAKTAGNIPSEQRARDSIASLMKGLQICAFLIAASIFTKEPNDLWKRFAEQEPPTGPSLINLAGDMNPWELARYAVANVAFLLPYGGDQLNQIMGGTSPRPLLDATAAIPALSAAASIANAGKRIIQTHDAVYPLVDLAKQLMPITAGPLNWAMPGDVIRRESYRAVRAAAPSDIELRPSGGAAGQTRESPFTPLVRSAANSALSGDEAGYQAAVDKAVKYQVGLGKTPQEAAKVVQRALQGKDPIRSTIGRPITAQEEARIVGRMSPWQSSSYNRAVGLFRRKPSAGGRGRSSRTRRPSLFARPKARSWNRRGPGVSSSPLSA